MLVSRYKNIVGNMSTFMLRANALCDSGSTKVAEAAQNLSHYTYAFITMKSQFSGKQATLIYMHCFNLRMFKELVFL